MLDSSKYVPPSHLSIPNSLWEEERLLSDAYGR